MLIQLGMWLSFLMAISLICFAYFEGIKIGDRTEKVDGSHFILSSVFGLIFCLFFFHFQDML
jgi:hypothetical protein